MSYLQTTSCCTLFIATSLLLGACTTKDDGSPDSGATDRDDAHNAHDANDTVDSAPSTGLNDAAEPGDAAHAGDAAEPGDAAHASDAAHDASGGSVSCYSAEQMRCEEAPLPSEAQRQNIPIMCSSVSGVFASPAACPTSGFVGKCVVGTGLGQEVRRKYTGVDAAYEADFCTNTAHGLWSTAF